MPNYYRDKYNGFIDNAEEIYRYLTGEYMTQYDNRLLDQGASCIELGKMQFVRLLRYRRTESAQSDFERIQDGMRASLRYCAGLSAAIGYFVVSDAAEVSIYIATEDLPTGAIMRALEASIPEISFQPGFISADTMNRLSRYGGIVLGNVECTGNAIDKILSGMQRINGVFGLLAIPMDPSEVSDHLSDLSSLKQISEDLLSDDANQNRRVNRRSYRYIPEIDSYLEDSIDYYGNASENYWKTCLWFGSTGSENAGQLGNLIKAALNGENAGDREEAKCFFTVHNPFQTGRLNLPLGDYSNLSYTLPEGVIKPSLVSYTSTSSLSSLFQFPTYSVRGFEVVELEKDQNSLRLFDTDYRGAANDTLQLGVQAGSGAVYSLNLSDLGEHVLITGATGAGKTNTVMSMARGICNADIPMLIIEPSKKDYWHLGTEIRNLKIYSFGQDALPLKINPLMPEEGTILANHIDNLVHAFSGAFEMEPPTRFALDGLLKYTYQHFGWRLGEVTYYAGRQFPVLHDLLALLPEYVNANLPYGEEVKNNIYGSLMNRLSALTSGVIGEAADTKESITGEQLCSGTVLVELDDLSLDTKPFMAMLLMIKVEQYLRQGNAAHSLKNLIVLEEAHNIFANVSGNAVLSTKKMASDSFSNMLSQIREYGTGIIIADQGASQINDTAVANTKVKIIHSVVDQMDVAKIAFALNLTDYQKRVFPFLSTGEAIVSVRGTRSVSQVKIKRADCEPIRNMACLFCPKRRLCADFNQQLQQKVARKSIYAQELYTNRFVPERLKGTVDAIAARTGWPEDRKLCLLGHLLADESVRCSDREKRRIIQAYQNVTVRK